MVRLWWDSAVDLDDCVAARAEPRSCLWPARSGFRALAKGRPGCVSLNIGIPVGPPIRPIYIRLIKARRQQGEGFGAEAAGGGFASVLAECESPTLLNHYIIDTIVSNK